MAEKKVANVIKLQIPAGAANPAPPVGPALGAAGVNIMQFCQAFNAQTADQSGTIIPVEITVYEDKSFTFIMKTPPATILIKKAAKIQKGRCDTLFPQESSHLLSGKAFSGTSKVYSHPGRKGDYAGCYIILYLVIVYMG